MLLEKIKDAGVIGCGGAGFPTHAKLSAHCEYLLINAAECEPLLKTDHYIMRHEAASCIKAIIACAKIVDAEHTVIATKKHYTEEIAALEHEIKAQNANIQIFLMDNYYPAGDEQLIVYEVTGRTVTPGGIPLSVNCIVSNISTMLEVYGAIENQPFTEKYLTITGAVKDPQILKVPVGTSFSDCISAVGGALLEDYIIVNGGPMMGSVSYKEDLENLFVTKTTSGILILSKDDYLYYQKEKSIEEIIKEAQTACIQCTLCTDLCPRHQIGHPIHPHKVMRQLSMCQVPKDIDDTDIWQEAQICSACGICEVIACPMGLSPRQVNMYAKSELQKKGIRYKFNPITEITPDPLRKYKEVSPKNIWYKMNLAEYAERDLTSMQKVNPEQVTISLHMNIGAPSISCVAPGSSVTKGALIADIPENQLGAKVHASISGKIQSVTAEAIMIIKE